jgi:hypothetical protein
LSLARQGLSRFVFLLRVASAALAFLPTSRYLARIAHSNHPTPTPSAAAAASHLTLLRFGLIDSSGQDGCNSFVLTGGIIMIVMVSL